MQVGIWHLCLCKFRKKRIYTLKRKCHCINTSTIVDNVPMTKHKHDTSTNSFTYSMLIFSLLLINSIIWLVPTILNEAFVEKGVNVLNNIYAMYGEKES